MRPDREVRYCMRVSYFDNNAECQTFTTGMLTQRFGLGAKTSKSQVGSVQDQDSKKQEWEQGRELTHLPLNKMATILADDIFKCIFF